MTDQETTDDWLSLEQAAVQLKVSVRTVQRYVYEGRLVSIKHAGKRWVTPSAIVDYVCALNSAAAKEANTRRRISSARLRGRGER